MRKKRWSRFISWGSGHGISSRRPAFNMLPSSKEPRNANYLSQS
jgi:hypothetical protein